MKSRFLSLFIPYLIGCLFIFLWILLLAFFPYFSEDFNDKYSSIFDKPTLNLAKSLFLFRDDSYTPLPYHLWFLRDLIGLVLLSLILIYFFKFLKWYFIISLLFVVTFVIPSTSFIVSMLYFSIGAGIHFSKVNINFNKYYELVAFTIYVATSLFQIASGSLHNNDYKQVIILVGIFGIWLTYDILIPKKFNLQEHEWLAFFCKYTFFIYIFHSPSINIFRHLIVKLIDLLAFEKRQKSRFFVKKSYVIFSRNYKRTSI